MAQRRIKSSVISRRLRSSGRVRTLTPPPSSEATTQEFHDSFAPAASEAVSDGLNQELLDLRAEVRDLRRLNEVIHFLGSAPDLATLRTDILDLGCSLSSLRRGMLALLSTSKEGKPRYKVKVTRGFKPEEQKTAETRLLKNILNRSLARRETLIEGDILEDGILGHAHMTEVALGAVVCLPLLANGQLLGAVVLDDPDRREPFTAAEQSLLRSFAKHAALAVHRLSDNHRMQRKATQLLERTDRLTAEREHLAKQVKRVATSSQRLACMLEPSYSEAKRRFTREYLKRAMTHCNWDLREASGYTGLPLARLIGLLDHLGLKPSGRWGQASRNAAKPLRQKPL